MNKDEEEILYRLGDKNKQILDSLSETSAEADSTLVLDITTCWPLWIQHEMIYSRRLFIIRALLYTRH